MISAFDCFLFVSYFLLLLCHLSKQNLKIGSLNINARRDGQKRALISEASTQKNRCAFSAGDASSSQQMRQVGVYGGGGGLTLPQPWHQPHSCVYIICECDSFIFGSRLIYGNINLAGFTDHHRASIDLVRTPGDRLQSHCLPNDNLLKDRTICQSFELFWQQWKREKSVFVPRSSGDRLARHRFVSVASGTPFLPPLKSRQQFRSLKAA